MLHTRLDIHAGVSAHVARSVSHARLSVYPSHKTLLPSLSGVFISLSVIVDSSARWCAGTNITKQLEPECIFRDWSQVKPSGGLPAVVPTGQPGKYDSTFCLGFRSFGCCKRVLVSRVLPDEQRTGELLQARHRPESRAN